jgi:G:T-mismatch repair DNA endonuclease (very short patch repair protein)
VPPEAAVYYAGDAHGILKEISKAEFEFWLKVLADNNEKDIEVIKKKISVGKKYTL